MPSRKAVVTPELAGALDRAVRGLFGTSWGKARAWIGQGKVRVGERVVTEPTARVTAGATLAFDERAARPSRRGRLEAHQVVYADAHVVVVAKPAGVSTVPFEGEDEDDALDARVRDWLKKQGKAARDPRPALGVVHRIDKETSGLVVFTRTWLAKRHLASQFRAHTVHRRYLAIAHGDVSPRTFRTFLVENRGDGLRGSAKGAPPPGAREAITHVERLEALKGATLVACRLETGRTHQIRIHLSEAGHPIVGERVYVRHRTGPLIEAPRLMLHAVELGFVHPVSERAMKWELAPPEDFEGVLRRLRG